MNKKYTKAETTIKVTPKIHILLLSFMPKSREIKNIKAHIAQGLKPSMNPKTIDNKGKENFLASICTIKGTSILFSF